MKLPRHSRRSGAGLSGAVAAALTAGALLAPTLSDAALTPQEETLAISKRLKPIPDDQWAQIAGTRLSETYSIVRGDSLFTISQRLFGDGKYWPKVWALNNNTITNPHVIRPGNLIAFMPGTGSSLPSVAIGSSQPDVPAPVPPGETGALAAPLRSGAIAGGPDWKRLPPQPWEIFNVTLPKDVDPLGFDKNSRIQFGKVSGIDLPVFAATNRMQPVGEVIASRALGSLLTLGDTVFIQPSEEIQIGQVYSLTRDPQKLGSSGSDRDGLVYSLLGRVKIIATRDDLFVGTIIDARYPISRGALLIPDQPKLKEPAPLPGPQELDAIMMLDPRADLTLAAEHEIVFLDRGSEDGIQPGMVFRAYQHYDPHTDEKITDAHFMVLADIMVLHVTEQFCTALILRSHNPIANNSAVRLLTDVSGIGSAQPESAVPPAPTAPEKEIEEIDRSDVDGGLGKEEEKELQQLEKWKEGEPGAPTEPDTGLPPEGEPAPSPTPAPEDTATQPPAESLPEEAPPAEDLGTEPAPETAPEEEPPPATGGDDIFAEEERPSGDSGDSGDGFAEESGDSEEGGGLF